MALREVRVAGDPILNKTFRPLKEMTERISMLIDDMFETMYDQEGVGLAAPQVGVLRRLFVIDIPEEDEDGNETEEKHPIVFINPEIVETSGEVTLAEGCLSLPNKVANVTRPSHVKIRALDRDMQEFEMEADDMLARCILHEFDHLDGHVYSELATGPLWDIEDVEEDGDTGMVRLKTDKGAKKKESRKRRRRRRL
ncbi:MAG: peptide deformylase [Lachnospiraceae bacterium]|nr:peptide deformylase [Lachnospiraceae bacterium]